MPRRTPTPVSSAAVHRERVRRIAAIQRQIKELLDQAGAKHQTLAVELARCTDEMRVALKTDPSPAQTANDTIDALCEFRVNVGELCSRFTERLQTLAPGRQVYPSPWEPIRANYAIVENRD